MGFGRSLELYFVDGRPDGLLTAKVFNWTGHILKAPRTLIKQALERPEAGFTGVYLLTGQKDGQPHAYVGEAEVIADRIRTHDLKKDWWTDVLFIATSANELNKAHARYLESRLIALARASGEYRLDNATQPALPNMAEAARANMEEFIDTLRLVLTALGVPILTDRRPAAASATPPAPVHVSPIFVLQNKKHGIQARAQVVDERFVVLQGSSARRQWEGKETGGATYLGLHRRLVEDGVIDTTAEIGRFTTDFAFDSPSAAAAVCNGRTANGQIEWKLDGTAMSYQDWERLQLGAPP